MDLSVLSASANLANAIMGAGLLSYAYVASLLGIGGLLLAMIFTGLLGVYGAILLIKLSNKTGVYSYEGLGRVVFGKKWGHLPVCIAIMMQNLGAMISYMVVLKSSFPQVIKDISHSLSGDQHFPSDDVFANGKYIVIFLAVGCILPLALLRDIRRLGFFSSLCMAISAVFVFFVGFRYFAKPSLHDICDIEKLPDRYWLIPTPLPTDNGQPGFLMSLPILAFSFVCHTTLLPIYKELPGNCLKHMKKVVAYAFYFCSVAYFLVGTIGYLSFSTDVQASILDNYAAQVTSDCHRADPFGPMVITIKLLFAISILLTIPLVHFPCRQTIYNAFFHKASRRTPEDAVDQSTPLLVSASDGYSSAFSLDEYTSKDDKPGLKLHIILTLVAITFVTLMSIAVPDITTVFGVAGATSAPALMYVLPGVMAYKHSGSTGGLLLAIVGTVTGTACFIATILSLSESKH